MTEEKDVEKSYSTKDVIAKLRRLADALESSEPFVIQVAGQRLRIPRDVFFNIEHEAAGGKHELEFQLRWSD